MKKNTFKHSSTKRSENKKMYQIGDNWITKGSIVLLIGNTDSGKSVTAYDMYVDLVAGRNIYGNIEVKRPMKSLYALLEFNGDKIALDDGVREHSCFSDQTITTISKNAKITNKREDWFKPNDFLNTMAEMVKKRANRPEIVFIDNANFININKSNQKEVTSFLTQLSDIIANKITVIFVLHEGKHKASTDKFYAAKGVAEWGHFARTTFNIEKTNVAGLTSFQVTKKASPELKDSVIYLSYSSTPDAPYSIEVRYTIPKSDKKTPESELIRAKYANLGFNFLPPSQKKDVKEYFENVVQKELKKLTRIQWKSAWWNVYKNNKYIKRMNKDDASRLYNVIQEMKELPDPSTIPNNQTKEMVEYLSKLKTKVQTFMLYHEGDYWKGSCWIGIDFIDEIQDRIHRIKALPKHSRPFAVIPNDFVKWRELGVFKMNK